MNDTPEFYSLEHPWRTMGRQTHFPLYPHLFMLQDGRLFYSGGDVFGDEGTNPGWLNLTSERFSPMTSGIPASFDLTHRDQSASVMLPPAQDQRVMIMGGGDPGMRAVHIIDLKVSAPRFRAATPMHFDRIHLNAVLLPDRTVLVTGGEQRSEQSESAAKQAEIFDPATGDWTLGAIATVPRMYHSIAMLLPDGRVITAGSNPEANTVPGGERRLELYHPPYLFRGPRPVIEDAPRVVEYGATVEIRTPEARRIRWVSLIRPMATTHSWDSNKRVVDVPISRREFCLLRAKIPAQPTIAPPGRYMLFITDENGVPSVASWVSLGQASAARTTRDRTRTTERHTRSTKPVGAARKRVARG